MEPDAVRALAAALRDLKNRKGTTFAALARRLSVSKSALHRYTSGEVVPAEVALVDLWARECGATPDETAELRRLWRAAAAEQALGAEAPEPVTSLPDAGAPGAVRPPRPARRRWAVLAAAVAVAGAVAAGVVAALPTLVGDDQPATGPALGVDVAADSLAVPASGSDPSSDAAGRCEARAGVRHVDARRAGHIWVVDYVCPNAPGVKLYDEPGSPRAIAVMETPKSWFTCWAAGPPREPGGSAVWYYTRGDHSEPGADAFDGWGFVRAEDVAAPAHPVPSMPACWFATPGAKPSGQR